MNNEEKILAILEQMQSDITGLKQGQVKLEQSQAKLEQGQTKLEQSQVKLEQGQDEIRQDYRALNRRVTIMESKVLNELGVIKDGISGWKERNEQIDELEATQKSHGNRIFALEQLVGK